MVRKIEQFQKLSNSFSSVLTPYERQEIFSQFPLWQETLNVCPGRLYTKVREEDIRVSHPWREHPFNSYVCFVKDHKKVEYHVIVFDVEEDFLPDKIVDIQLYPAGEYRMEVLNGNDVVVFASNRYYIGIAPVDSSPENTLFFSNVRNAIGNWWYGTKPHNWKCINKAVVKMHSKTEGKIVPNIRPVAMLVQQEVNERAVTKDAKPTIIIPISDKKEDVDTTVLVPIAANMNVKPSTVESLFSDVVWHDITVRENDATIEKGGVLLDGMPEEVFESLMDQPTEDFLSNASVLQDEFEVPAKIYSEDFAVSYAPDSDRNVDVNEDAPEPKPVLSLIRPSNSDQTFLIEEPKPNLSLIRPLNNEESMLVEDVPDDVRIFSPLTPSNEDSNLISLESVPSSVDTFAELESPNTYRIDQ